jgi:hypothetical protein
MGKYDLPAEIDYILKETSVSKLTYVGLDRGLTQIIAALSFDSSYYVDRVQKIIGLRPCVKEDNRIINYDEAFTVFDQKDVFAIYGPDWKTDYPKVCLQPKGNSSLCPSLYNASAKLEAISI